MDFQTAQEQYNQALKRMQNFQDAVQNRMHQQTVNDEAIKQKQDMVMKLQGEIEGLKAQQVKLQQQQQADNVQNKELTKAVTEARETLNEASKERNNDVGSYIMQLFPEFANMDTVQMKAKLRDKMMAELQDQKDREAARRIREALKGHGTARSAMMDGHLHLSDLQRIMSAFNINDPIDTPDEAEDPEKYDSPFAGRDINKEMSSFVASMKLEGKDKTGHEDPQFVKASSARAEQAAMDSAMASSQADATSSAVEQVAELQDSVENVQSSVVASAVGANQAVIEDAKASTEAMVNQAKAAQDTEATPETAKNATDEAQAQASETDVESDSEVNPGQSAGQSAEKDAGQAVAAKQPAAPLGGLTFDGDEINDGLGLEEAGPDSHSPNLDGDPQASGENDDTTNTEPQDEPSDDGPEPDDDGGASLPF